MNPIFAQGYACGPDLLNPTNRGSAMVLPPLNGADVKKIMLNLAHHQEQVIFLSEPNLMQPRIREYQLPRDVPKQQPSLPGLLKLIAATGLKMNQVDVGDVQKN